MKFCFILGTRPEIIKLYSCIKFCEKNNLDFFIIHSNQHFSENMDRIFFEELKLPQAKYHLGINGRSHAEMTGRMLMEIEKILIQESPTHVLVQWDTNTVLSGALAAAKLHIPVIHIEAGLRSYDKAMPEEINRICVDHISDFLFVPNNRQKEILVSENIDQNKIFVVWNTIVDVVYDVENNLDKWFDVIFSQNNIIKDGYILLTLHRPSNVDNPENLKSILLAIDEIARISHKKIFFPIHPRTKNNIIKFWFEGLIQNFIVVEPIGFMENIFLEKHSFCIITDSGWIQEEACILEKKVLILRDNTERPEVLEVGGAILVWSHFQKIVDGFNELISRKIDWYNPFWNGNSAEQIFQKIKNPH